MSEPTLEITDLLDTPFYSGDGATAPPDLQFPCAIDGRGFHLDFNDSSYRYRYQQTSVNLLNTQQPDSGDEGALVPPEVWRRSIESWDLGAGQRYFDRKESVPTRFFDSHGIDVFERWEMSLLHKTSVVQGLSPGRSWINTVSGGQITVACAFDLFWWVDLSLAPINTPTPARTIDATNDGNTLYLLGDDGHIYAWANSASPPTIFATAPSVVPGRMLLRFLKGFLVLAVGPALYDLSTGSPVLIYTHPLATHTWRDGAEGQTVAYLVGGQGDRWSVWGMQPKADATTYDVPVPMAPIPDGETALSIASYLGYVMVGMNTGWRFAVPDNTGQLQLGRLIGPGAPVYCFEGQDRFVWFGVSGQPPNTVVAPGLGRTDLSQFTASLTPTYANDLETDLAAGTVWDVDSFQVGTGKGLRIFTVEDTLGGYVYIETTQKVDSGYLEQGTLLFATSDQKVGLYAQAYYDPLFGEVDIDLSYDGADWKSIGRFAYQGAVTSGRAKIETAFNTVKIRYTLRPSLEDPQQGPTVTRMEIRVLPVSIANSTEFHIPVVLTDEYNVNGAVFHRDIRGDKDLLLGLVRTKRLFIYREGTQQFRLYASDFSWLGDHVTQDGRDVGGTFVLIAREAS